MRIGVAARSDVAEQEQGRFVGPMHVVEHEDHGRRSAIPPEKVGHCLRTADVVRSRVRFASGRPGLAPVRRDREASASARRPARRARRAIGPAVLGRVVLQRLGKRLVRYAELLVAAAPEDRRAPVVRVPHELRSPSRVLPMPGSPETRTTRRAPSADSFHAIEQRLVLLVRCPANGKAEAVSTKAGKGSASIVVRGVPSDVADRERLAEDPSAHAYRAAEPRTRCDSPPERGRDRKRGSDPPVASAHNRAASTTGVPNQSPSSNVASPTRDADAHLQGVILELRLWRSTARCMATAPATASAAPV